MSNKSLLQEWQDVLDMEEYPSIKDYNRKVTTAQILENTKVAIIENGGQPTNLLAEAAPANNTANIQGYDPILISLVRRAMPNLIAYDIAGVQPMTGPTGLIFAMRSNYIAKDGTKKEAFYDEADTAFSGTGTHTGKIPDGKLTTGTGMSTAAAEALGDTSANSFAEMGFEIDKVSVTAVSRAMKAEYTSEMAQDLKSIHGLDAETELANLLAAELLADINREMVRTVWKSAVVGSQEGVATKGTYDLDVDADGRWSVEKFKGLMFQIEREANAIAKSTRRGKGNIILCSSDVASALQMAGILDYAPALNSNNNLSPDDTGNTFVGVLNGRFRVYIDPYAGSNYLVVGYKGASTYDAGLFYCPYVPLQMVRAVGENSFQSKIGFKTRYGMVANPFSSGADKSDGTLIADKNVYYRKTIINNLH